MVVQEGEGLNGAQKQQCQRSDSHGEIDCLVGVVVCGVMFARKSSRMKRHSRL
jgi:hypothetical protein